MSTTAVKFGTILIFLTSSGFAIWFPLQRRGKGLLIHNIFQETPLEVLIGSSIEELEQS